jgi:DNA-binding NarL/FixJ family response regulator
MSESIVVTVDCDNEIFGRGISVSLREDPNLVVTTAAEKVDREPDVAVVSPSALRSRSWECPVLVCTDAPFEVTALDATLAGTLPRRQLTQDQLLSAVRAAAAGLRVGMLPAAVPEFDHRTVAVLRLIADGAGTREISSELGYSERTIKTVIAEAVRGLGARNRAHAVAEAMRRALI